MPALLADTAVFFLRAFVKKCCRQVRFPNSKYTKMRLRPGLGLLLDYEFRVGLRLSSTSASSNSVMLVLGNFFVFVVNKDICRMFWSLFLSHSVPLIPLVWRQLGHLACKMLRVVARLIAAVVTTTSIILRRRRRFRTDAEVRCVGVHSPFRPLAGEG